VLLVLVFTVRPHMIPAESGRQRWTKIKLVW
jgi:hypothetical protein